MTIDDNNDRNDWYIVVDNILSTQTLPETSSVFTGLCSGNATDIYIISTANLNLVNNKLAQFSQIFHCNNNNNNFFFFNKSQMRISYGGLEILLVTYWPG